MTAVEVGWGSHSVSIPSRLSTTHSAQVDSAQARKSDSDLSYAALEWGERKPSRTMDLIFSSTSSW